MEALLSVSSHTISMDLLPERPFVLDVGARNFGFTKALLELRPNAIIHAIEPDPTVTEPFIPEVIFHSMAMVHDDRAAADYAMFSTGEGNYLTHLPWLVNDAKIVNVPTMNIASFSKKVGVKHWDLIKLDCELAEFLILENWPEDITFGQITVEFHDFNTLDEHGESYYEKLWTKLKVKPLKFDLTSVGLGIMGHWDTLLVPA